MNEPGISIWDAARMMPQSGQTVTRKYNTGCGSGDPEMRGRVVARYETHLWYRVEFPNGATEGYKFDVTD